MKDIWIEYECLRQSPKIPFSPGENCFLISSYDDVESILKSDKVTVEFPFRASRQVFGKTILDSDDPNLLDIKREISSFFSKKQVKHYKEEIIRPIVRSVICHILTSDNGERALAYNSEVAQRIPTLVIMRIFGIKADHEYWIYERLNKLALYIDHPSASLQDAINAKVELMELISKYLDEKEDIYDDGILANINSNLFENKEHLINTCVMLLTAGMATTIAAFNTLIICIYEYKNHLLNISNDEPKLINFIEEIIRINPPLHATIRFVKEDFDLNNSRLTRNSMLKVILASANRDKNKYKEGDQINLDEEKTRSCTFGKGKHACIGGQLAVYELVVFTQEFLPIADQYTIILPPHGKVMHGNVIKMFSELGLKKADKWKD